MAILFNNNFKLLFQLLLNKMDNLTSHIKRNN